MKGTYLVRGARQLVTLRGPTGPRRGEQLGELTIIEGGAMVVQDGRVACVGPGQRVENLAIARKAVELNAEGKVVMPGFVDSHTHLIYGAPRLDDFERRIAGMTYAEMSAAGGGILQSWRSVKDSTGRRLKWQALAALKTLARLGTTTVEVKSGYGLEEGAELKMLRVAQHLQGRPQDVVPTYLAAHALPPEFQGRPDAYVAYAMESILPKVAKRKLARYVDAYCERGVFEVREVRRLMKEAQYYGLKTRLHASQFDNNGAVQLGVEEGAASVDHLEAAGEREIQALAGAETMATLLPGSVAGLGLSRFAPARELIARGAAVALATDFNPGTSQTPSMSMVMALACRYMKMTPAEALTAATINGAHALGMADRVGTLEVGKQADYVVLQCGDYREVPYYFGVNLVQATAKQGEIVWCDPEFEVPPELKRMEGQEEE